MRIVYREDEAKMLILAGGKIFKYGGIPLAVANRVRRLNEVGAAGKVWGIVKEYELIEKGEEAGK